MSSLPFSVFGFASLSLLAFIVSTCSFVTLYLFIICTYMLVHLSVCTCSFVCMYSFICLYVLVHLSVNACSLSVWTCVFSNLFVCIFSVIAFWLFLYIYLLTLLLSMFAFLFSCLFFSRLLLHFFLYVSLDCFISFIFFPLIFVVVSASMVTLWPTVVALF
jgi:hypothetical protein